MTYEILIAATLLVIAAVRFGRIRRKQRRFSSTGFHWSNDGVYLRMDAL